MRIKPSEGNDFFCTAPWTHTYLSPQGERRLCCASREKANYIKQYIDAENPDDNSHFKPVSLEDHWNSDYMKDIRKRIMSGESIPQCQVCNDQILNLYTYKGYFTNTLFPHKIDEIFEKTEDDGYTHMKPISYDYRISNLCNFKCRMCGDLLSSQWEAERKIMGNINLETEPFYKKENQEKFKKFQKEVTENELWEAVKENRIEEIYWVGGEPLMWDIHWDIMKYLVDNNQSKNVIIRYNTNLSRVSYKGMNLYDFLPHFKRVNLCASIDGTGKIVEFIRTGIVWEKWLDNFKGGLFLNDLYGDHGMVFDLTITLPGLLSIKELFDHAVELNVVTYIKTTFSFDSSVLMSPLSIPRPILEEIIDDTLDYIKPRVTSKTQIYVEALEDLKTKKTFEESYPDYKEGRKRGKENMIRIAEFRKDGLNGSLTFENILGQNKKLLEWWTQI
jgi:hypothetical protein